VIKLVGLLKRKEGMSVEDFQRYWRDVHGPIMARTPGMRRYVQSHALPELYGTALDPAFDGVAEAWFDSLEAYEAARETPEWRAGGPDARNFMVSAGGLVASEVVVVGAYASARERQSLVKYMGFLKRLPGMSVEEFQRHWREVHGPLVVRDLEGMLRYVQCHPLPETYAREPGPSFDGVPQAWFGSMATYPAGLGRRRSPDAPPPTAGSASEDSASFIQQPIAAMIAREVVILD
jgi:uncharacterized protein (TIGR02118 family)